MAQTTQVEVLGVTVEKQFDRRGSPTAVRLSTNKPITVSTTWIQVDDSNWIQAAINYLNALRKAQGWTPLDDEQVSVLRRHLSVGSR